MGFDPRENLKEQYDISSFNVSHAVQFPCIQSLFNLRDLILKDQYFHFYLVHVRSQDQFSI